MKIPALCVRKEDWVATLSQNWIYSWLKTSNVLKISRLPCHPPQSRFQKVSKTINLAVWRVRERKGDRKVLSAEIGLKIRTTFWRGYRTSFIHYPQNLLTNWYLFLFASESQKQRFVFQSFNVSKTKKVLRETKKWIAWVGGTMKDIRNSYYDEKDSPAPLRLFVYKKKRNMTRHFGHGQQKTCRLKNYIL